jgi:hypothetical protein
LTLNIWVDITNIIGDNPAPYATKLSPRVYHTLPAKVLEVILTSEIYKIEYLLHTMDSGPIRLELHVDMAIDKLKNGNN